MLFTSLIELRHGVVGVLHHLDDLTDRHRLGLDVGQGRGGLGRQRLDLLRHHRKAAAGGAGMRRLDGGVERQEIGLAGDRGNQGGDLIDILDGRHQRRGIGQGVAGAARRLGDDARGIGDLGADFADRGRQFLDRCGDAGRAGRGFAGDGGGGAGVALRFLQHRGHAAGEDFELGRRSADRTGDGENIALERDRDGFERRGFFRLRPFAIGGARRLGLGAAPTALSRNTATARAMAPISSVRRLPSIGAPRSPSAMRLMVSAIRRSGRET